MSDRRTHPDAAAIAGFIDGTLPAQESRGVATHIAECDECVAEVGEISLFAAEERAGAPTKTPVRAWAYGLAATLAIAIAGSGVYVQRAGGTEAVMYQIKTRKMASATAAMERPIDGRLSWFKWSRYPGASRGVGDEEKENYALQSAASDIILHTKSQAATAQHARGVAYLLLGNYPQKAVDELSKAAAGSRDASVWNDLAVAHEQNRASLRALEAVNHALTLDPHRREALFNRALILGDLGRESEAAAAWIRYLAADPSSPWATEAREHLAGITNPY